MRPEESHLIVDYFLNSDPQHLARLGVDPATFPESSAWNELLREDFGRPMTARQFFYVLWELDGVLVGHSHIGDIAYGREAYMHLHIWQPDGRRRGHGTLLVRDSAAIYFAEFHLKRLLCQPNAYNVAPNRTLQRVGFEYLETIETTPSWLNFRQPVTRWSLTKERFDSIVAGRREPRA